jgi:hypothetical protein
MRTKRSLIYGGGIILVSFLVIWSLSNYVQWERVDWSRTKDFVGAVQGIFTIFAIVGGAVWTYFNYFKGRVYQPRLEPKVTGRLVCKKDVTYVIASAELKNLGLSNVAIQQKGSGLVVSSFDAGGSTQGVRSAEWDDLAAFPVFENHAWVEPGETINDQRLIVIPNCAQVAIMIRLRLVFNKIEWNVSSIIEQDSGDEDQIPESLLQRLEEVVERKLGTHPGTSTGQAGEVSPVAGAAEEKTAIRTQEIEQAKQQQEEGQPV